MSVYRCAIVGSTIFREILTLSCPSTLILWLRLSSCQERLSLKEARMTGAYVLYRQVPYKLSCLERMECANNDTYHQQWLSMLGTAEAAEYLCSSDTRGGK